MLEEYNTITFSVLLTSNEFSLLGRLLTDYESREIPVEVFARELLKLISDEEKVIIGRIKYRFILALQYNPTTMITNSNFKIYEQEVNVNIFMR